MKKIKKFLTILLTMTVAVLVGYFVLENVAFKNTVKVYFVKNESSCSELAFVRRNVPKEDSKIKVAVTELLKGPNAKERQKGLVSEIPSSTKLNKIEQTDEKIIVDLSHDFEEGGGSNSLETRINQLVKTVSNASENKPVYLELDGEQVEAIGGEGVAIDQPLNKKAE